MFWQNAKMFTWGLSWCFMLLIFGKFKVNLWAEFLNLSIHTHMLGRIHYLNFNAKAYRV